MAHVEVASHRLNPVDGAILVMVAFLWGFNFVVIAVGLDHFPPLLFSALRFLICAFPAVLILPRPAIPWRDLIALGVVLGTLLFGFLFVGIHVGVPPGLASLVMQTQVFFTLLLGVAVLGERPRPLNWVALAIGFLGIALIATEQNRAGSGLALLLVLSGALSWGVANVMMKRLPRVNMLHLMVWISLVPPLPLIALSLVVDGPETITSALAGFNMSGLGAVLYTGLVSTVLAYGVWGRMLQRYPTAVVTPFALLVPLFGLGSAVLALGERYTGLDIAAGVLVLFALVLNTVAGRRPVVVASSADGTAEAG